MLADRNRDSYDNACKAGASSIASSNTDNSEALIQNIYKLLRENDNQFSVFISM